MPRPGLSFSRVSGCVPGKAPARPTRFRRLQGPRGASVSSSSQRGCTALLPTPNPMDPNPPPSPLASHQRAPRSEEQKSWVWQATPNRRVQSAVKPEGGCKNLVAQSISLKNQGKPLSDTVRAPCFSHCSLSVPPPSSAVSSPGCRPNAAGAAEIDHRAPSLTQSAKKAPCTKK